MFSISSCWKAESLALKHNLSNLYFPIDVGCQKIFWINNCQCNGGGPVRIQEKGHMKKSIWNTSLRKREGAELYFILGMRIMGKLSLAYLYNGLSAVDEKKMRNFPSIS